MKVIPAQALKWDKKLQRQREQDDYFFYYYLTALNNLLFGINF